MNKLLDPKIIVSMLLLGAAAGLIYFSSQKPAEPKLPEIPFTAISSQKYLSYTIQTSKFKFQQTKDTFDIINEKDERVRLKLNDFMKAFLDNWTVTSAFVENIDLSPPAGCNFLRIDVNYVNSVPTDVADLVDSVVCLVNEAPNNITTVN